MLHAGGGRTFQQVTRSGSVVTVVLQRVRDGFRHDGMCREMHDGVHLVFAQHAGHQRAVRGVADHEFAVGHRTAKPGRKVVQNHDAFAGFTELTDHVAADITGTAGHENGVFVHASHHTAPHGS